MAWGWIAGGVALSFQLASAVPPEPPCGKYLTPRILPRPLAAELAKIATQDTDTRFEALHETRRADPKLLREIHTHILEQGSDGYYAELEFIELMLAASPRLSVHQPQKAPGSKLIADFLVRDSESEQPIIVELKTIDRPGGSLAMERKLRRVINEAVEQIYSTQNRGRNWVAIRMNPPGGNFGFDSLTGRYLAGEDLGDFTRLAKILVQPRVERPDRELEGLILLGDEGYGQRIVSSIKWTGSAWQRDFLGVGHFR